jgi:hypothetical protein
MRVRSSFRSVLLGQSLSRVAPTLLSSGCAPTSRRCAASRIRKEMGELRPLELTAAGFFGQPSGLDPGVAIGGRQTLQAGRSESYVLSLGVYIVNKISPQSSSGSLAAGSLRRKDHFLFLNSLIRWHDFRRTATHTVARCRKWGWVCGRVFPCTSWSG